MDENCYAETFLSWQNKYFVKKIPLSACHAWLHVVKTREVGLDKQNTYDIRNMNIFSFSYCFVPRFFTQTVRFRMSDSCSDYW